jgi:quinol-cytochrome oxidoreductase complex cytochrome b subunit
VAAAGKVRGWLDERLPVAAVGEFFAHKTVPSHRYSVFYYLGGMTLFFFAVQVATGILLMLYYRPSAQEAFESVEFIMTTVTFGWLIRSIHAWSANLMVLFAVLHLVTVYLTKAYRPPRELTWITGCVMFFLLLAFGFSGYLLPWNELSFFATKVGTNIAGSVPWVGEWLERFLRGGDRVSGATLSRFYGWHVAILPALVTAVLVLHLLLVQVQGMSTPPGRQEESARNRFPGSSARRPIPSLPLPRTSGPSGTSSSSSRRSSWFPGARWRGSSSRRSRSCSPGSVPSRSSSCPSSTATRDGPVAAGCSAGWASPPSPT